MNDHIVTWIWEERLVQVSRLPEQVFIRFGKFSRLLPSINFSNGKDERGLSVYPARLVDGVAELVDDDQLELTPADCASVLSGRCVFVVTGKVVGRGSDGEPLLKQVKLVPCAVSIDSIKETGYEK